MPQTRTDSVRVSSFLRSPNLSKLLSKNKLKRLFNVSIG